MKTPYKILLIALTALLILAACAPASTPAPSSTATVAATQAAATAPAAAAPTAAPTTPAATPTSAPTATQAAAAAISVPDGLGGTLTVSAAPKQIVSLAPSNAEVIFAIGAGSQMAAREDFTNFPAEAAKLPSVGGMAGPISVEQIISFKPDLVMVAPISPPELIKGLQDLKIPVLLLPNPKSLADMYANLTLVGKLTGHDKEAASLVTQLQTREKAILAVAAKATSKPTVFYELDGTDPAKPWTSGPGTFVDMLIGLAGGQNIGAKLQGEWAQLSQEELLVQNPDLIILGDANFGMTVDQIKARAGWSALKAVSDGKVLPFNDDLVSRPGPRMIDGLAELLKAIHPELASELK